MTDVSLVMKGSFGGGTSLDEVLSVVGISRQWMEVVLDDEERPRGRILCKSGQVVAAFAAPDRSGLDAFVSLYRDPTRTFAVYQRPAPPERIEPLGALADLIAHAQGAPAADLVLEGTFHDYGIREVLDVLSIGRQVLELVAARADGSRVVLRTKAGRVLSCEEPERGTSGIAALQSLLKEPGQRFRVTRRPGAARTEPLGKLADLVAGRVPQGSQPLGAVVLEGTFADTPLDEVLDTVGLTRQLVELVLGDEVGTRGAVLVKAGRVLAARSARSGASGREAFVELMRDPGQRFSILRRSDVGEREPIGRLAELVAVAAAPPPPTPVLQGRFGETGITDLLDSVGLSRQLMEIRLSRHGRSLGRILVKGGQLLDVEHGSLRGRQAFRAILDDPGTLYRVTRHEREIGTDPLGSIAEWLAPDRSAPPIREIVLEGTFADASIVEVLGTFSLTRQHVVALFRAGGRTRGRLALKAGRVLEAEHLGRRGVDAFRALLLDPGESFVVYRMPPGAPVPEPLGRLQELLGAATGPPADDDGSPPTMVLGATFAEDAPTIVGPIETLEIDDADPLEERLRELTEAIVRLERALSARTPEVPSTDRVLLLGLVVSQLATVFLAGSVLLWVLLGG